MSEIKKVRFTTKQYRHLVSMNNSVKAVLEEIQKGGIDTDFPYTSTIDVKTGDVVYQQDTKVFEEIIEDVHGPFDEPKEEPERKPTTFDLPKKKKKKSKK